MCSGTILRNITTSQQPLILWMEMINKGDIFVHHFYASTFDINITVEGESKIQITSFQFLDHEEDRVDTFSLQISCPP